MRKRSFMIIGLMFLFVFLAATASVAAGRVAVIGFESADLDWFDDGDREEELLEDIAWLLNDKLAEVDEYTVLNRERVLNILDAVENTTDKKGKSDTKGKRPAHSIINQLRNQINADYFILGSLDRVEVEKVDEYKFGPIEYSEVEVTVDLSIDMINVRTDRLSESYSGSGSAKDTGVDIVDSQGDRIRINLFSDEPVLEKAIERAVDSLIASLTGEEEEPELETRTIETEIVSIVRDKLVINKGERDGLELGQSGEIIRPGDPDSIRIQDRIIGAAEVTELDANSAILETIYIDQDPEVGDMFNVTIEDVPLESYTATITITDENGEIIESDAEAFRVNYDDGVFDDFYYDEDEKELTGTVELAGEVDLTLEVNNDKVEEGKFLIEGEQTVSPNNLDAVFKVEFIMNTNDAESQ